MLHTSVGRQVKPFFWLALEQVWTGKKDLDRSKDKGWHWVRHGKRAAQAKGSIRWAADQPNDYDNEEDKYTNGEENRQNYGTADPSKGGQVNDVEDEYPAYPLCEISW